MGAANEVADMNTSRRTHLVAGSATVALVVVDGGKVVYYRYGILGTFLCTETAGYTPVGASLTHLSALVMAVALYDNALGVIDKMNDSAGTLLHAETAADALSGIYLSDILLGIDADGITGANPHTVAVSKTGEGTVAVALIIELCAGAGCRAGVNVFSLIALTGAVAGYVSDALNNVTCRNAENVGNILGNAVAAGDAESGFVRSAVGQSLCISVTSGEAASTAIRTGKAITYSRRALILLHSEESGGNGEKQGAKKRNDSKNQYG